MDKFHIYEVIGKGKYSEIFKGREKKKIDFVAIKRVDKAMMNSVVNEVQIMHKLQNPHILKFHDWYETRHNLWLILEYCTGADLEALLLQDGYLPETSIRFFALDILSGLKYIHSLGIIHCDIRPKSFLIDEFGILKFSKFTFSRKIQRIPLGDSSLEQRGFLPIMAPELFENDGVHSFASDFWSLGCTLYYLRQGFLPYGQEADFAKENFTLILPMQNPVKIATTQFSGPLGDLISWLMEISPGDRCLWETLCSHPFWEKSMLQAPVNLPPNHVFDSYVKNLESCRKQMLIEECKKELGYSPVKLKPIDALPPKVSDFTPIRPKERRDAHRNIKSTHESKFSTDEDLHYSNKQINSSVGKESPKNYDSNKLKYENKLDINSKTNNVFLEKIDETDDPVFFDYALDNHIYHNTDFYIKPIVGNRNIETLEKIAYTDTTFAFKSLSLEELIKKSQSELEAHLTQIYSSLYKLTQTIANNNNHQNNVQILIDISNILGYLFGICTSQEVSNIIINTNFLNSLLKLIKLNIDCSVSNKPISRISPISKPIHNISHSFSNIKIYAATIIATILRFATFVIPPTQIKSNDENILSVLLNLLKDYQKLETKFRRRIMAATGEMVFYIAAQEEESLASNIERWALPSHAAPLIMRQVVEDTDEIVKHYAAKTIENILSQGNRIHKIKFVNINVAMKFLDYSLNSKNEALQITCGLAFSHLVHVLFSDYENLSDDVFSKFENLIPSLNSNSNRRTSTGVTSNAFQKYIAKLFDKSGIESIIEIVTYGVPKLQVAFLNVINSILAINIYDNTKRKHLFDELLKPYRASILTNAIFINLLVKLVEHGDNTLVKAKSMLCLLFFCLLKPNILEILSEKRFSNTLVRILESTILGNFSNQSNSNNNTEVTYQYNVALSIVKFLNFASYYALKYIVININTSTGKYDKASGNSFQSPTLNRHNSNSTPITRLSPKSKEKETDLKSVQNRVVINNIYEHFPLQSITDTISVMKSVIIISSHSLLRKYVYCSQYSIQIFTLLSKCIHNIKIMHDQFIISFQNDVLRSVEDTVIMFIETLSKMNLEDNLLSLMVLSKTTDSKNDIQRLIIKYVDTLSNYLYPSLTISLTHIDPNYRVNVVALIRRILPGLLRCYLLINLEYSIDVSTDIQKLLKTFISTISNLITDVNPIPQYIFKLIQDIILEFDSEIAIIMINFLLEYNTIQNIMNVIDMSLKSRKCNGQLSLDINTIITLRILLNYNSLCDCIIRSSINYLLVEILQQMISSSILQLRSTRDDSQDDYDNDQIITIETFNEIALLIQSILHKVISTSTNNYVNGQNDNQQVQTILDLRNTIPSLYLILNSLSRHETNSNKLTNIMTFNRLFSDVDNIAYKSLLETITLNKEDLVFKIDSPENEFLVCDPPRVILSNFLKFNNLEYRIVIRIFRFLLGLQKISVTLKALDKVREFLSTDPIRSTIFHIQQHYIQNSNSNDISLTKEYDRTSLKNIINELNELMLKLK